MNDTNVPTRFLFCIVTHNSAQVIYSCLKSLSSLLTPRDKIVVMDNASTDGTVLQIRQSFPEVRVICQPNIGFGRANNVAFDLFPSHFFVLMNPDTEIEKLDLDLVALYFEKETKVASVTGDIHFPNNTRQYVHKRFPNIPLLFIRRFGGSLASKIQKIHKLMDWYEMRDMDFSKEFQIPCASGAFQILHRQRLPAPPLFDPRFFLYFEDTDLSRRIWEIGETRFLPWIRIRHRWDRGSHKSFRMLRFHITSLVKYFVKWGLRNPKIQSHRAGHS